MFPSSAESNHTLNINPFTCYFFRGNINIYLIFHVIPPRCYDTAGWNPSSGKTRTYKKYFTTICAFKTIQPWVNRYNLYIIRTIDFSHWAKMYSFVRKCFHIVRHLLLGFIHLYLQYRQKSNKKRQLVTKTGQSNNGMFVKVAVKRCHKPHT